MRLIMAGGGTGGHLFPGLAVARELQRRDPEVAVLFVGTKLGIEGRVLPREGFPLATIPIRGVKGRKIRGFLEAAYGIPASLVCSFRIIRGFRPDLIVGLGGYASGPVLLAGKLLGVRSAILEQNLRPGVTNRILGWIVDRVFTSYPESASFFPRGKVIETGNPVRWSGLPELGKDGRFTVLVFGGSAGAHRINTAFVEALPRLADLARALKIIHQTGEADFASIREVYSALPFEAEVLAFVDAMDEAYARSDLVIARAGASTVAELALFGKPAVLVPYPYAADDHQRFNAAALAERGAAEVIHDRELSGEKLAEVIRALYLNPERLREMGKAARKLARPDAAQRIVDECLALLGRPSGFQASQPGPGGEQDWRPGDV